MQDVKYHTCSKDQLLCGMLYTIHVVRIITVRDVIYHTCSKDQLPCGMLYTIHVVRIITVCDVKCHTCSKDQLLCGMLNKCILKVSMQKGIGHINLSLKKEIHINVSIGK